MHKSLENLNLIKNKINQVINEKQLKTDPKIVVISKTFSINKIAPLFENGHIHFGENKIREAENKWRELKNNNKNLQLHMVGKLQTNKVKKAIKLFDYIHSLDNQNLALKIQQCENELKKKTKLFIQVNVADEPQKSGIQLKNLQNFYNYCTKQLTLNIIGLMCLPPINNSSIKYFKILKKSADEIHLKDLSMGMSSDFHEALVNGSTYLRLGTAILGKRNSN